MDDPDTKQLAAEIERLEGEIERIEDRTNRGKTTLQIRSHDLHVQASSEDATLEEMSEILGDEMETLSKRALVGEYQKLEEEDLFMGLFDNK